MNSTTRPFGCTQLKFDIEKINGELNTLIQSHPFDDVTNQINITHRPAQESFYDGVGSLYNYETNKFTAREKDFQQFNKILCGTYIEQVYNQVKAWSPFALGRVRFMRLKPKSCLSMHRDLDIRYHIPLQTSNQAYFVMFNYVPFHLPADGSLFWVNTLGYHSVFNGHPTEDRIHLVFSTAANDIGDYIPFLQTRPVEIEQPITRN